VDRVFRSGGVCALPGLVCFSWCWTHFNNRSVVWPLGSLGFFRASHSEILGSDTPIARASMAFMPRSDVALRKREISSGSSGTSDFMLSYYPLREYCQHPILLFFMHPWVAAWRGRANLFPSLPLTGMGAGRIAAAALPHPGGACAPLLRVPRIACAGWLLSLLIQHSRKAASRGCVSFQDTLPETAVFRPCHSCRVTCRNVVNQALM
jgi:hypothetical protein